MRLITLALAAFLLATAAATAAPPPSGKDNGHIGTVAATGPVRNAEYSGAECPNGLDCRVAPAAYAQNSPDPGDYGNYDLANRPNDGLAIRYIVVHDTEFGYDNTIAEFQNPLAYVSAHYVTRKSDGQV